MGATVQPQDPHAFGPAPQGSAADAASPPCAEALAALSQANAKLQELNRHKDEFISRVSHELRTPIAAIHQFASILADGLAGETTAEQNQYLGIILRNTKELHSMVADLIEATRAETGKLRVERRRCPIAPLVEDVVLTAHALATGKGVKLAADVPRALPSALADPQRVRQILVNLVDNAMKFTPEHGSVRIQARLCEEDARFLCIEVEDTGEGMSPEVCARAFDRLFQDRSSRGSRQGLGLGLTICKSLVELQGGRIRAASVLGQGSRFTFTLPVFALADLVRPILAPGGRWVDAAAIVRIDLVPRSRYVARRTLRSAVAAYREVLADATPEDLLLLPELDGRHGDIEILAATGPEASRERVAAWCEAIAPRLAQRLHAVQLRIEARALPLAANAHATDAERLRDIAARIEHGTRARSRLGTQAPDGFVAKLAIAGKDPMTRVHQEGCADDTQDDPHRG